jgi:hypothetical protein
LLGFKDDLHRLLRDAGLGIVLDQMKGERRQRKGYGIVKDDVVENGAEVVGDVVNTGKLCLATEADEVIRRVDCRKISANIHGKMPRCLR